MFRRAWLAPLLALLPGCGRKPEAERPPLVLLVTVDTLRADRIGACGSELGLTPNLDALAAGSVVFRSAFAPASFTVPSVTSILTGCYPEQNVIYSNEHVLPEAVPTLATRLAARGYRTGAVVSNFVLRAAAGLSRGFEVYDDELQEVEAARHAPERSAPRTTAAALKALDRLREAGDAPVFLWVHYQDPHGPYTPPEEDRAAMLATERARPDGGRRLPFGADHRGLDGIPDYQRIGDENEVAFYRAGYDGEVRYCDRAIGELLDGVRKRGLWDRAVIVFAADHGEGLGEREYWFAHGEYLDDALVHVPLFVRAPGVAPARRSDVAGLVDVAPTLLPIVGLVEATDMAGRDLLAPGADARPSEVCIATLNASTRPRIALVAEGHRYVATAFEGGRVVAELYSLEDPSRNTAAEEPDRVERMRKRLLELRATIRARGEERRRNLTPADIEAMRKLGYTGAK